MRCYLKKDTQNGRKAAHNGTMWNGSSTFLALKKKFGCQQNLLNNFKLLHITVVIVQNL